MKAIFNSDIDESIKTLEIKDDKFHHLVRVLRAEENESILILNGKGFLGYGKIQTISKKDALIEISNFEIKTDTRRVTVFAAVPKQDTADLLLRQAIELNIRELIFVETEYSHKSRMRLDRFLKIVESAIIQANNAFSIDFPRVIGMDDFIKIAGKIEVLTLIEPKHFEDTQVKTNFATPFDAIFIGPEGGFSQREAKLLHKSTSSISIAGPIMRFETALPFALGMIYSKD